MESGNRVMVALTAPNIRSLVTKANKENVQRENIISLLREREDQFVLIYYK